MNTYSFIFLVGCLFLCPRLKAQTRPFHLTSVSIALGHHSIGSPFAIRRPFHSSIQVDMHWRRQANTNNRRWLTSAGYVHRPNWSHDLYLLLRHRSQRFCFEQKAFIYWDYGLGLMMSQHLFSFYHLENGRYVSSKWNLKVSGLLSSSLGLGVRLSNSMNLSLGSDWRLQLPHGGGLPFLPHSFFYVSLSKHLSP